jgi:hypothetical protein
MHSHRRHVESTLPVPECRRKDAHGGLAHSHIQLTGSGQAVSDKRPLGKIGRVIDRYSREVLECRCRQKIVIAHPDNGGVGIEFTDHGIAERSRLRICGDTIGGVRVSGHHMAGHCSALLVAMIAVEP